jgi:hypothetical protein
VPRSVLITRAHSECLDDDYHLDHGLCVLRGTNHPLTYNDPPLGEAILALPLHVLGVEPYVTHAPDSNGHVTMHRSVFHGQRYRPDTLRMIIAIWKSILFLPCVAVAFVWVRRVYGARSAWLGTALLLVEPTIAAHIPVAALDVLAMEGVIVASFCVWRWLERPTTPRLVGAGVATAVAMLIKHTAVVLPLGIVALVVLHRFARPWWRGTSLPSLRPQVRPTFNAVAAGGLVVIAAIWPLTMFDTSRPSDIGRIFGVPYEPGFSVVDDVLHPALSARWPAGIYVGSIFEAMQHGREGHSAFLRGEVRDHGWWYYFFAVAMYKVPVGVWAVMILGAASLLWVRPRWDELFILVPAVACGALIMSGGINIGFRHALPAYGMLLLLATRCVSGTAPAAALLAWGGVLVAAVHVASYHPDYLSYTNGLSKRPWLAIADSNLDWGQSLKQLDQWLGANPQPPDRTIHFDPMDDPYDPALGCYVRELRRLTIVPKDRREPPESGLLITSPCWLAGIYNRGGVYARLRDVEPVATIGHSLLVYDLDAIKADRK